MDIVNTNILSLSESIQFKNSIYSFTYKPFWDENLPSFAVSTLVSSDLESTPYAERYIFPLFMLNPKDID